jgi:hypothetical protein
MRTYVSQHVIGIWIAYIIGMKRNQTKEVDKMDREEKLSITVDLGLLIILAAGFAGMLYLFMTKG